jgi:glycosyltransferase involved in cell wall biosynthesis
MPTAEREGTAAAPSVRRGTVLIIVDRFPMHGGTRVDKFVKLLPEFGYRPVVISSAETESARSRELRATLYPPDLLSYRARSLGWTYFAERYYDRGIGSRHYQLLRWLSLPERALYVPDHMVRSVPQAKRLAARLIRELGIDVVLTSSPPESTHLVGLALQRRLGIPWVADFRDLWTEKRLNYRPATPLHDWWIKRLERRIFTSADHVVANTSENAERYANRFGLDAQRMSMIPNGYDADDIPPAVIAADADVFEIGYMGNLDKHDFPWRLFFDAFARLAHDVGEQRVRLVHCGFYSKQVTDYLRLLGIEKLVRGHGMLPHADAMQLISRTRVRLVLLYENPYSSAIVPAKLYNYLIMQGPILAIAPEQGVTANIIAGTRMGSVISPARGVEPVYRQLREYFEAWANGSLGVRPDPEAIAVYDRRTHVAKLADIFDRVRCDRNQRARGPAQLEAIQPMLED